MSSSNKGGTMDYNKISKENNDAKKVEHIKKQKEAPVIKGKVTRKKKSMWSDIKHAFISDESTSVKSYVVYDVLIPAVKRAMMEMVTNGIHMAMYGKPAQGSSTYQYNRSAYTSASYSNPSNLSYDHRNTAHSTLPDEIRLDYAEDAQAVLHRMEEILITYGVVRVADYYDLLKMSASPGDFNYGWRNLSSARVISYPTGGYAIKLPRTVVIN